MSWAWPSSDSTTKVIPAFVNALQAVADVTKDKKVNAGQMNYTYADLAAVLDAVKPVLTPNGLAITQAATNQGVSTVLLHASGEWLSFPPLEVRTGQNTPQAQGSALTYARRYSLLAALNVATEDDDGQAAAVPAPKPVVTAARREAEELFDRVKALDAEAKSDLKAWADGASLSVDALEADADLRGQLVGWLGERA